MDLKETELLGDNIEQHWYYRAKSLAVMRLLKSKNIHNILDVGAGSGFFSEQLLRHTSAIKADCVDTGYSQASAKSVNHKPMNFLPQCGAMDSDCVLMMDVIEHVEDDVALIREYVEKVPSGAHFLISVPAFNFLWSSHDVFLEHFRRYSLAQLETTVEKSSLEIINSAYFYGLVFPIAMAQRLVDKFKPKGNGVIQSSLQTHGKLTNSILFNLCQLESSFFHLNKLAGLTAFCLAKKV